MEWVFSDFHSLTQLEIQPDGRSLFLGFATEPKQGVFSQKFPGSKLRSVSEAVWCNEVHWPQDMESIRTIAIHTVHGVVTLDGVIALFLLRELPSNKREGFFDELVRVASEAESGKIPSRFEVSMMAWFASTMQLLRMDSSVMAHPNQINHLLISKCHSLLHEALKVESTGRPVDFDSIMDLPVLRSICRHQRQLIETDAQTFWEHDVHHSIRFEAELPSHNVSSDRPTRRRLDGLATRDPRSHLYRFFARSGRMDPIKGLHQSYPLTYVHRSALRGAVHEHVISIDPAMNCHLREVSAQLETLEDRIRPAERARDNPRAGYDYNDPWYDARHSDASIIDTPSEGSVLQFADVLGVIGYQTNPAKSLYCNEFRISSEHNFGRAIGRLLDHPRDACSEHDRAMSKEGKAHEFLDAMVVEEIQSLMQMNHWVWDPTINTIYLGVGKVASIFSVLWLAFWLNENTDPLSEKIHLYLGVMYDGTLEQKADEGLVRDLCDQLGRMNWACSPGGSATLLSGTRWLEITTD